MSKKKKWTCYRCNRDNYHHTPQCQFCGKGYQASICELCHKPSWRPLLHVVKDRGATAFWEERSVAPKHIDKEYRKKLVHAYGKWICGQCARPDMIFSRAQEGTRYCIYCRKTLRSTNPNLWCGPCEKDRFIHRQCRTCGKRLEPEEYQYCKVHRVCQTCGKVLGGDEDSYCRDHAQVGVKPASTQVLASLREATGLDTNDPMPAPRILGVKERARRLIGRHTRQIASDRRHIERLEKLIQRREKSVRWCEQHNDPVNAEIFRKEIGEIRAKIEVTRQRIEHLESVQPTIHRLLQATRENHTWRPDLPVKGYTGGNVVGSFAEIDTAEFDRRSEEASNRKLFAPPPPKPMPENREWLMRDLRNKILAALKTAWKIHSPAGVYADVLPSVPRREAAKEEYTYYHPRSTSGKPLQYTAFLFCEDKRERQSEVVYDGIRIRIVYARPKYLSATSLWYILGRERDAWLSAADSRGYVLCPLGLRRKDRSHIDVISPWVIAEMLEMNLPEGVI